MEWNGEDPQTVWPHYWFLRLSDRRFSSACLAYLLLVIFLHLKIFEVLVSSLNIFESGYSTFSHLEIHFSLSGLRREWVFFSIVLSLWRLRIFGLGGHSHGRCKGSLVFDGPKSAQEIGAVLLRCADFVAGAALWTWWWFLARSVWLVSRRRRKSRAILMLSL